MGTVTTRRTVVRTAVWTTPVVAAGLTAPAFAGTGATPGFDLVMSASTTSVHIDVTRSACKCANVTLTVRNLGTLATPAVPHTLTVTEGRPLGSESWSLTPVSAEAGWTSTVGTNPRLTYTLAGGAMAPSTAATFVFKATVLVAEESWYVDAAVSPLVGEARTDNNAVRILLSSTGKSGGGCGRICM